MVRFTTFSLSELTRWVWLLVTKWARWEMWCSGPSAEDCQHWAPAGGRASWDWATATARHDRGAPGPALRPANPRPEDPGDVRGGQQEFAGDLLLPPHLSAPPEVRGGGQLLRLSGPAGSLLRVGRGVFLLCFPDNIQLSLCFRVFTKRLLRSSQAVRGQPVLGPHWGVQGERERELLVWPPPSPLSYCRTSAVALCLVLCLSLPPPTLERTCRAWIPPSVSSITRRAGTAPRSSPWRWPPPVSAPSYSASWPASSWPESASVVQTTRITCLTSTGQWGLGKSEKTNNIPDIIIIIYFRNLQVKAPMQMVKALPRTSVFNKILLGQGLWELWKLWEEAIFLPGIFLMHF